MKHTHMLKSPQQKIYHLSKRLTSNYKDTSTPYDKDLLVKYNTQLRWPLTILYGVTFHNTTA